MYFLEDATKHAYATIALSNNNRSKSRVVVMARVDGDKVIVEVDITDRPVYEALMQAGIPDSQIVLAYEKAAPSAG